MVKELTKENYKELIEDSNNIIFIDFYSPTCGPCQQLLPFLEKMDKHFENDNVQILKCNVEQEIRIAKKYMIRSVPTTVVIDLDKKIKSPNIGLSSAGDYINMIEKELNGNQSILQKILSIFK